MIGKKVFYIIPVVALIIAAIFFVLKSHHSISGVYIDKDENAVQMLKLTEKDGKLSGQFQSMAMDASGNVKNATVPVEGTVSEKDINLSFGFTKLVPALMTASGTSTDDTLVLTSTVMGEAPQTHTFVFSDAKAFQVDADALKARAQQMLSEKSSTAARTNAQLQQQNFIVLANQLVAQMQKTGAQVGDALKKLPQTEDRYHDITTKMQADLAKIRPKTDSKNTATRSQTITSMKQSFAATDQINTQTQMFQAGYAANVEPLVKSYKNAQSVCAISPPSANLNLACQKLHDTGEPFTAQCKMLVDMLESIAMSYQKERGAQQVLLDQANQIQ